MARRVYEAVVKVLVSDPPGKRARDIHEGVLYAGALLMDEYGWTADEVGALADELVDQAYDRAEEAG